MAVQSLRSLRWRAAIMVLAAGFVISWVFMSGRGGYLIQIDYAWGGEFLDSAAVMIDGDTVGILRQVTPGQRVTGFEVEPGEHVVSVQREGCEGRPDTVSLGPRETRFVLLMADVDDGYRCRVVLR
jgi:hypothetical protein